jgi:hypothetical protein
MEARVGDDSGDGTVYNRHNRRGQGTTVGARGTAGERNRLRTMGTGYLSQDDSRPAGGIETARDRDRVSDGDRAARWGQATATHGDGPAAGTGNYRPLLSLTRGDQLLPTLTVPHGDGLLSTGTGTNGMGGEMGTGYNRRGQNRRGQGTIRNNRRGQNRRGQGTIRRASGQFSSRHGTCAISLAAEEVSESVEPLSPTAARCHVLV